MRAGPADRALELLNTFLDRRPRPDIWVLAGDQVYVDATAGLFDPTIALGTESAGGARGRVETFDHALRLTYTRRDENPWWSPLTGYVPMRQLIDDHEIVDNWEPSFDAGQNTRLSALRDTAVARFPPVTSGTRSPSQLWFADTIARHQFFFGDTRTERTARCPKTLFDADQARIMSKQQMRALTDMLLAAQYAWPDGARRHKFVATPSILLPRRLTTQECAASALRSDAWDGYPASLHALLAFIANHGVENCVFLSGDEHLCCVATVTVQRTAPGLPPVILHSIHAGAMYGPWPFANSIPEDFARDEEFEFEYMDVGSGTSRYRCSVRSWFPPRAMDGFATASVDYCKGGANLRVSFHGVDGKTQDWPPLP